MLERSQAYCLSVEQIHFKVCWFSLKLAFVLIILFQKVNSVFLHLTAFGQKKPVSHLSSQLGIYCTSGPFFKIEKYLHLVSLQTLK